MAVTTDPQRRAIASRLAQDLLQRRLYKLAYLGVHEDLGHLIGTITEQFMTPAARVDLENELADMLGFERGDILVHIPAKRMMVKDAEVRVERSDRTVTTLAGWDRAHSKRVDSLNDAHARLWRLMVFVRPAAGNDEATRIRRRLVAALGADFFGAPSRYVPSEQPPHPEPWDEALLLRTLSHLDVEVAREVAVERALSGADVRDAAAVVRGGRAQFRETNLLAELRAVWSAALPVEPQNASDEQPDLFAE